MGGPPYICDLRRTSSSARKWERQSLWQATEQHRMLAKADKNQPLSNPQFWKSYPERKCLSIRNCRRQSIKRIVLRHMPRLSPMTCVSVTGIILAPMVGSVLVALIVKLPKTIQDAAACNLLNMPRLWTKSNLRQGVSPRGHAQTFAKMDGTMAKHARQVGRIMAVDFAPHQPTSQPSAPPCMSLEIRRLQKRKSLQSLAASIGHAKPYAHKTM